MDKFRQNLRKFMTLRKLSQADLAKRTGIDQGTISHYLGGKTRDIYPSLKNLIAITEALNCTLEDLTENKKFRHIEKTIENPPEVGEAAMALARFYESLPDDDHRKKVIEDFLMWDIRDKEDAAKEKNKKLN